MQCWWMILKGLNCDEFNLSSSNCCKNIQFIFHPTLCDFSFSSFLCVCVVVVLILLPLVCNNLYYFLPSSQSKYEFDEIITNTQSIIILIFETEFSWNSIMKRRRKMFVIIVSIFFYLDLWFWKWLFWCVWCYTIFYD